MKKPSNEEDEYFAREEALRRHKLALEKAAELEKAHLEELKRAHFMKCPKCGFDLQTVQFKGFAIDKCFHCNGNWLDAGELEALAGRESGVLKNIVGLFKK